MNELAHQSGVVPASPMDRLAYGVRETAQLLGVSDKSVRRLIARGLLKPSRALRHLLIPRAEIERFLKETM
jgi:excisionase family DNA binding protein